jgi:hypothetical protein
VNPDLKVGPLGEFAGTSESFRPPFSGWVQCPPAFVLTVITTNGFLSDAVRWQIVIFPALLLEAAVDLAPPLPEEAVDLAPLLLEEDVDVAPLLLEEDVDVAPLLCEYVVAAWPPPLLFEEACEEPPPLLFAAAWDDWPPLPFAAPQPWPLFAPAVGTTARRRKVKIATNNTVTLGRILVVIVTSLLLQMSYSR